ncbi:ferrous iron transport protein A [bacterium]|jgi:Fe2+ transport system protein FeoA|nr:ferrous iron transport protein A [bacterium]
MSNHIRLLSDIHSDEQVEIYSIEGEGPTQHRVIEMGCTPGTPIRLIQKQAFGGPIIAMIRDAKIAIRKSDAQLIKVCS